MGIGILNSLAEAEKYFKDSQYKHEVEKALIYYHNDDFAMVKEMLSHLPTKEQLLKRLVHKLEGKSIYRTLKKIEEGKIENDDQFLKGLFSLGTHIAIECEKGNKEFSILYPVIYEKLGKILYTRR